jgi:hypothetical protein
MTPAPASLTRPSMRRFLIGLTLTLLLIASVGIGIVVARWPEWRHVAFQARPPGRSVNRSGDNLSN